VLLKTVEFVIFVKILVIVELATTANVEFNATKLTRPLAFKKGFDIVELICKFNVKFAELFVAKFGVTVKLFIKGELVVMK